MTRRGIRVSNAPTPTPSLNHNRLTLSPSTNRSYRPPPPDTLLPRVPNETTRTAAINPALRVKLSQLGIDVIPYRSPKGEIARNESGYLHAHPQALATLGRKHGAQWVATGQQHKFSFLISWLNVQLVDINTGLTVARADSALRGAMKEQRMNSRMMNSLRVRVNNMLQEPARRKATRPD